jgi:hypothetical protein
MNGAILSSPDAAMTKPALATLNLGLYPRQFSLWLTSARSIIKMRLNFQFATDQVQNVQITLNVRALTDGPRD